MPEKRPPLFLIAGGPGQVRRRGADPLLQTVIRASGKTRPAIAYVGAASGDNPAFRLLIAQMLLKAGAGAVVPAPMCGRRVNVEKTRRVLEDADLVFISGGDVEEGMKVVERRGMTPLLKSLHAAGKPFFGVSAGSIMLAERWVRWSDPRDDESAELFPCLGFAPVLCDTHGESDGWTELQAMLRLCRTGATGLRDRIGIRARRPGGRDGVRPRRGRARVSKEKGRRLPGGEPAGGKEMEYRRLGSAGLKVSVLSYGSWVTYGKQVEVDAAVACMKAAWDAGVNFFDNAEAYEAGKSEEVMGAALRKLGWRRASYVVSTKIFFGMYDGVNERMTLNRKKLREGIDGGLKRFGLDYIDLVFCHRPDPETPIEEVVWSMHMMVESGKALYWGTSEWNADQLAAAWGIAEKHHLHKPQMEQPQYNLFVRSRVEKDYVRLYDSMGLGLTTWSPLAAGVLTGSTTPASRRTRAWRSGVRVAAQGSPAEGRRRRGYLPALVEVGEEARCHCEGAGSIHRAARAGVVRPQPARELRHHRRRAGPSR